jgi:transposase
VIRDKEMYDEIQYQKRTMLFDLIETKGYAIEKACKEVGMSKSTYYRLKRIRDEQGLEALISQTERREIQVADLDISQKILSVVIEHPEYSAKKIGEVLSISDDEKESGIKIDPALIYRELKRLKLSTKEKRVAYSKRKAAKER